MRLNKAIVILSLLGLVISVTGSPIPNNDNNVNALEEESEDLNEPVVNIEPRSKLFKHIKKMNRREYDDEYDTEIEDESSEEEKDYTGEEEEDEDSIAKDEEDQYAKIEPRSPISLRKRPGRA